MLKDKQLKDALLNIHPSPFTGNCYRLVNLKYPLMNGDNPISGDGALYADGRFNRMNNFKCVYLGETLETVQAEVFGYNKPMFPPYLLITVEVSLSKVLDLTNEGNMDGLDITLQELTGDWRIVNNKFNKSASTQILAEYAYGLGYEGIKYYSSKAMVPTYNIVIFVDKLSGSSYIRINDSENLIEKLINK